MAEVVTLNGTQYTVHPEDGGVLVLRPVAEEAPVEAHNSPLRGMADPDRPYIRPLTARSALVRIWHENRMVIAVMTHCTDRAVRIVSREDTRAAWIPKNVLEYASTVRNPNGFYCLTADDYTVKWHEGTDVLQDVPVDGAWELWEKEFAPLYDMYPIPNNSDDEQ